MVRNSNSDRTSTTSEVVCSMLLLVTWPWNTPGFLESTTWLLPTGLMELPLLTTLFKFSSPKAIVPSLLMDNLAPLKTSKSHGRLLIESTLRTSNQNSQLQATTTSIQLKSLKESSRPITPQMENCLAMSKMIPIHNLIPLTAKAILMVASVIG